tara:strand:- start:286 stop:513 length:228 start_codon:yes stop_codon:yes gene_type:complete
MEARMMVLKYYERNGSQIGYMAGGKADKATIRSIWQDYPQASRIDLLVNGKKQVVYKRLSKLSYIRCNMDLEVEV